jgi:hypothetical protein
MRFTVLAGADAEWFAKQVEPQALNSSPDIGPGKMDVCVRWAVPGAPTCCARSCLPSAWRTRFPQRWSRCRTSCCP